MVLERQLSSAGCSTSYAAIHQSRIPLNSSFGRRGVRARCAAQPRPYHGSHSPERDSNRRHVPPHRTWSPVAASAATVAPSSPSRDGLRSLPADLITSIPDAIPCLKDLEDLHNRAMQSSPTRSGRFPTAATSSSPRRAVATPNSAHRANGTPHIQSNDSDCMLPPDASPVEPPRAERNTSHTADLPQAAAPAPANTASAHPPHAGRSALFHSVPLSQPLARPNPPPRDAAAASGGRTHHSAFSRRRAPGVQPVMQLTMVIKGVRDWRRLPGLLADLAPDGGLDSFNAAAFLTHLAQLVAAAPPSSPVDVQVVERMQAAALAVVEPNLHEYRARQVSNMTWALARLGLPSGASFVREHLLPATYPLLPWYEPQHLSNTLWALATAGLAPDDGWLEEYLTVAFVALQRRALAPQHLANVLWALERMGVMPDQEWMGAFYDCVEAAVPSTNSQDCSNILSSLALMAMHEHSPETTAALAGRLAERLQSLLTTEKPVPGAGRRGAAGAAAPLDTIVLTPTPARSAGAAAPEPVSISVDVSDQSIANSLWALAVMGVQPGGGLWEAVTGALRQRMADPTRAAPGVHPAALTIVLWAATTLRRPLPAAVTGLVYGRVRGAQMEAMEARSLATMVWAIATAPPEQARPPPDWVADAVAASGRSVLQLGSQGVSNVLYGLCQLDARPAPAWMSAVVNHFHRNLGAEASGQSVSNVLWCLAKMGYRLNAEGMDILVGLVRTRLAAWQQQQQQGQLQQQQGHKRQQPQLLPPPPFSSQEMSNVLYAIASMDYAAAPGGELAVLLLEGSRARLHEANAQELSNFMWSLAALQIPPSAAWLVDFYAAAEARLPTFQPRDLAQTLYGAAKLRLPLQQRAAPAADTPPAAAAWVSAALSEAPRLIATASAQDLCNLSWALVQLGVPVDPGSRLAVAFTARLVALAAASDPSQLALGVWALGKWRVQPTRPQMDRLELATFRQVPSMRPHELAAMMSGFAGMGHNLPTEWLADAMQQVAARSREFGPQDWTVMLYALARVQDDTTKPQTEELVQRLVPRLHRLPVPSLVLLAYSCGCMGPNHTSRALVTRCLSLLAAGGAAEPAGATAKAVTAAALRAAPGSSSRKHSTGTAGRGFSEAPAAALPAGKERRLAAPPPPSMSPQQQAEARAVSVSSLTAVELSALLWSAVRVGVKVLPHDFRDQFFSRTQPLLSSLPASLVASYLWAAGRLRMWLPAEWRKQLVERGVAVLGDMRARELVMCMSGLMWLRVWPSQELLDGLRQCLKAQGPQMPEAMRLHAETALDVLVRRAVLARFRERRFGLRRGWLARVRLGNERAAAEGKGRGLGAGAAAKPRPEGFVSRRGALVQGVMRRRPSRLPAVEPACGVLMAEEAH